MLTELGYSAQEATQLVDSGVVPKPAGAWEEKASREARAKYAESLRKRNAAAAEAAKSIKSRL